MTDLLQAAKMALDVLEHEGFNPVELRQAIAQAEQQEPVALVSEIGAVRRTETGKGVEHMNALQTQIDGRHYADLNIQPIEYIHANNLPFIEGCVVKYISRWRSKGGLKDLQKIKHFVDLLIELEGLNRPSDTTSVV